MTHHPFCLPPATSEGTWRCVGTCTHDREEYVSSLERRLETCEAALDVANDLALDGLTRRDLNARIATLTLALQKLVVAAEAVALRQPAARSRTQPEADGWGDFYEAIHAANKVLFGLEDA